MARVARFKVFGHEAWYHLHSRIAGRKGEYGLAEAIPMRRLIDIIQHYSGIYFCDVAAFSVMGNHYHLIVRFDEPCEVSRQVLRAKSRLMYPSRATQMQVDGWSDEQWEHYRRRLFDVSEYMRNIQAAFARWYNHNYLRRGRFWADRFKSVYLEDKRAVLDCMLYVELNAVRAGLVPRPEEWKGSSLHLREAGVGRWLMPLTEFVDQSSENRALTEFRERLYYRGNVSTRANQAVISQDVLAEEIARGFTSRGMYLRRLRYWVDGLAVGSEEFIRAQIARLREDGQYSRRKNPISHLDGIHQSLREQRRNAVEF